MEVLPLILFDLDGTLLDSNEVWRKIDFAFLGRRGLVPTEEYLHTVGHSIFPVAARFTQEYYHLDMTEQAIMDEWQDMAWDAYAHHLPLKPGARALLTRLAAAGTPMAMLTACVPALCRAALERHGLTDFFEQIIFAQEMGLDKRDPEVFRRAAAMLGVPPEACTLFDDAPGNCAAAKSVGMTVVGVYDPFYEALQPQLRASCHRYLRSLEDV